MATESIDNVLSMAKAAHRAGRVEEAAAGYREVLRLQPDHPGAWHLLGVALHQQGCPKNGIAFIRRAIELAGPKGAYLNNLGVALRALGRSDEALDSFREALRLQPNYADAWANLALVLHELGEQQEAINAFERTLEIQPNHADALLNFGRLCLAAERHTQAHALMARAFRVRPESAAVCNGMGNVLWGIGQVLEAMEYYRKALAHDPRYAEAHLNLGMALALLGNVEEAGKSHAAARRLRPENRLWEIRPLGICPAVFASTEQLDAYRRELEARLDAVECRGSCFDGRQLETEGVLPSFHLAHHGRNDRPLKEKFASLLEPSFSVARPQVGEGMPRIGFLATGGRWKGLARGVGGVIEHMDRRRFQPVVFCSPDMLAACRERLPAKHLLFVPLPDRLAQAAERVRESKCDVLYYWTVGRSPLDYLLPFTQPAPVQVTSWGSHVTTGIRAMDYFLSSEWTETAQSAEHYTEKLFCLRTLPLFHRRILQPSKRARADFGLPENAHLLVCPQRVAKFHPDQDELFGGVLEADLQAVLVFFESRDEGWRLLRSRWNTTLAGHLDRLVFLPEQSYEDFHRVLLLADALLDTRHFGVGFVAFDALAMDLPIVTLPGEFNMSRAVQAMYRLMNIEGLVASSVEEYVRMAVSLGTDDDYRETMRRLISERKEVLFESEEVVREHERFFETAIEAARHPSRAAAG